MHKAFWIGAAAYPALELLWRGRTHPAMALAGGLGMRALAALAKGRRPLWKNALLGGLSITGIEWVFGCLFNRRHTIWDYRRQPCNLKGQICLPFTMAWCALSGLVLSVWKAMER